MFQVNFRVLIGVVVLALALGVINNFRVAQEKRVTWFGGQPVFAAPAEVAP